jgi:D-glycero-D-manno-heptose 1,7-bisphosphate phosphatase
LVTDDEYRGVAAQIERLLAAGGAHLDAVYMCPHAPEIDGPCPCRKPATLLYERAAREHNLDFAGSWHVGDRASDLQPALSLGGRGLLVLTGNGPSHQAAAESEGFEVVADVGTAVDRILGTGKN